MALSITCSGCDAVYPVGENLIGKTIRCKKCGEMMPVTAPSKSKPVIVIEDEGDDAPRKSSRRRVEDDETEESPRRASRRREEAEDDDDSPKSRSKRRVAAEEDDEDDRPRRGGRESEPKKSKKPLILGGLLTLILVGGGAAASMFLGGDEDEDRPSVAALDDSKPKPATTNPETGKTNDSAAKANPVPTPPATPPVTTPPMTTPMTTAVPAAVPPISAVQPKPMPPVTQSSGPVIGRGAGNNGGAPDLPNEISQLNIARVKRAAVFIKTTTEVGEGNGSGWIGLESDLVFTNAHVLSMKAPNSPEPKKLTFYLNAGTPDQIEIPHSKLKILAVDRDADLAVVKIVSFPNLPTPLKLRMSAGLRETETVYTIGFPLGQNFSAAVGKTKKEPSVSVRKTTVSGTQADDYGQIVQLKLEGGVNPGNSGGAIVDANGDVIAVVRAMIGGGERGNWIGLAIPTEFVNGLVAGRVAKLEYGIPYRDKDKVKVPVTANILNPFEKSIEVNVRHWIGDTTANYRVPGNEAPKPEANDAGSATTELKYDAKTKTATGELVYTDAPAGRTYWAQPFYSNALTLYRMPGIKVPMDGPPVERVPTNLASNPKLLSRRAVTLSNSNDLTESAEGEGESKDEKIFLKTTLKLNETVEKADNTDQAQAAKLRMQFESIKISVEGFGGAVQQDIFNKSNQEQINALIKAAVAYGLINRFGEMYRYTVNLLGINDPLFLFIVTSLSNDALEALQATSIRMPNKVVAPGETWTSDKDMRLYLVTGPSTLAPGPNGTTTLKRPKPREYKYRDTVTYKYLGLRDRAGRKEAVVMIEGKSIQAPGGKQTVTGSVKGIAWIEIETGVVVEASIQKEFELDSSSEGNKKRVTGIYDYKLTRGTAQ